MYIYDGVGNEAFTDAHLDLSKKITDSLEATSSAEAVTASGASQLLISLKVPLFLKESFFRNGR